MNTYRLKCFTEEPYERSDLHRVLKGECMNRIMNRLGVEIGRASRRIVGLARFAAFAVFLQSVVFGQLVTSDISGLVNDATGAAIPGATVTVTNTGTRLTLTGTSEHDGVYRIHGIPPGTYNVRVEATGFQPYLRQGVTIEVNQQISLNFDLKVGSTRESITVVGDVQQIETSTGQVSSVVNTRTLSELPLNGRDLFGLTLLQPGVVPDTNAGGNQFAMGNIFKGATQGTRPSMFNITSDGSDINDPGFNIPPGGPAGVQLGVEATQEYRVLTNAYDAEYGRNAGANVQYVTKSGTNDLHGSLYEFIRNSDLDARNYFDVNPIPEFRRNQFGASLGGPIKKDKLFYFVNYESLREIQAITDGNLSVPDAAARAGYLPSAANPSTLVYIGLNPNSAKLMALYPLPNGPDIGGGTALWSGSQNESAIDNHGVARVDYNLSPNDQFFVRYTIDKGTLVKPSTTPGFPLDVPSTAEYGMISWQRVFSPTLFNQVKVDYNRTAYVANPGETHGVSVGLTPNDQYLGSISNGYTGLGYSVIYPLGTFSNVPEFVDNASWDKNKHSIKFGADVKPHIEINGPYAYGLHGSYTFSSAGLPRPALSTNPTVEDFLLGDPFTYTGVNPALSDSDRYFRQNYLGFYIQDDWKVTPRLTLNIGVRWEYQSDPTEKYGRAGNIPDPYTATTLAITPGPVYKSVPLDLWSPRFGFAWQPFGTKTSIRGGYGLMRDQLWENLYGDIRLYLPYYEIISSTKPNFFLPPTSLAQLGGPVQPVGSYGITFTPDMPYYHEFSMDVDRELSNNLVLRVGYAGSDGIHLPRTGEVNPVCQAGLGLPINLCPPSSYGVARINPNFGSTPVVVTDATSHYNALEVSLKKRFSQGLQFQISYTWSHNIDTASGPYATDSVSQPGTTENFFNLQQDKGPASIDRRHVFVANYLYALPIGSGHLVGGNATGFMAKLINGWNWGGILSLETGPPFTVINGSGLNNAGINSTSGGNEDRPNVVAGANMCANTGNPNQWFSPSIYSLPAADTWGDVGRNTGCGPPLRNLDTSLIKQTKITERVGLEFRAELFNIFNITNFQIPSYTIFSGRAAGCTSGAIPNNCGVISPTAGRITATTTASRQIQFAMRLVF